MVFVAVETTTIIFIIVIVAITSGAVPIVILLHSRILTALYHLDRLFIIQIHFRSPACPSLYGT